MCLKQERRVAVLVLTLDRPAKRNALSLAMRAALAGAVDAAGGDPSIGAIVITGSNGIFAAGADLAELYARAPDSDAFERVRRHWRAIACSRKPIVAAVDGLALGGGCELALACDLVVASEQARFGLPEITLGIMPGAGGVQRLVRRAGAAQALRWLLTGEQFDAEQARRLGIVSEIVDNAEVLPHALSLATRIATMSPHAVAAIRENAALAEQWPLEAALDAESVASKSLLFTPEARAKIQAFLNRSGKDRSASMIDEATG